MRTMRLRLKKGMPARQMPQEMEATRNRQHHGLHVPKPAAAKEVGGARREDEVAAEDDASKLWAN
jgi:hypothetical protein